LLKIGDKGKEGGKPSVKNLSRQATVHCKQVSPHVILHQPNNNYKKIQQLLTVEPTMASLPFIPGELLKVYSTFKLNLNFLNPW
jgi:hypothetical protein